MLLFAIQSLAIVCVSESNFLLTGVNVNGLEFGMGVNGPNSKLSIPGKLKVFNGIGNPGDFYAPRPASLATLVKNGANVLRLAFSWARLVPNMAKS